MQRGKTQITELRSWSSEFGGRPKKLAFEEQSVGEFWSSVEDSSGVSG